MPSPTLNPTHNKPVDSHEPTPSTTPPPSQSARLIAHLEEWLGESVTAQKFEDTELMSAEEAEEAGRASACVSGLLNQQGELGRRMRQVVHAMTTKGESLQATCH